MSHDITLFGYFVEFFILWRLMEDLKIHKRIWSYVQSVNTISQFYWKMVIEFIKDGWNLFVTFYLHM